MREMDLSSSDFKRTSRYIRDDKEWFFKTREGELKGPFPSLQEAKDAIEFYKALKALQEYRPRPYVV